MSDIMEYAKTQLIAAIFGDTCIHCGGKIAKRYQHGRSVFADPCGHRLYQGEIVNPHVIRQAPEPKPDFAQMSRVIGHDPTRD